MKLQRQLDRTQLVIVDELGYVPFSRDLGQLLFHFFWRRYERLSVIVTTNLQFSRWGEIFTEADLTALLLDRLCHRSHIFLLEGESFRFREAKKLKGQRKAKS